VALVPFQTFTAEHHATGNHATGNPGEVDYSQVSETVWVQWRQRIVEHGLERETLGRFAPSLQRLSHVIWRAPLGTYTPLTLTELRSQKTYGEKRVRAVLEVFGTLYGVLGSVGPQPHLAVRYVPRTISRLEDWIHDVLSRNTQITDADICNSFIDPLIQQIIVDGGEALADLAQHRLGLHGPVESVLNAARRLGYMRARVYQLLNEMSTIVSVRWPDGPAMMQRLNAKLCSDNRDTAALVRFEAARSLFCPEVRVDGSSAGTRTSPGYIPGGAEHHQVSHTHLV